ncbi:MAG: SCP2 sterol-binding domain-containing protein [Anaerolineales bacterium]|nr:SCP2 sterol-binding domain-containing protein [Anaerolineales bacterium]
MTAKFPSPEWLQALAEKLNSDRRYAEIAQKWEGDMIIVVQPAGPLTETLYFYLDLWHGTCRKAEMLPGLEGYKPAFILTATYDNITKILLGQLDPMQAMMTRKLHVQGNMAIMMRSVPIVLDFVRCAREITTEIL